MYVYIYTQVLLINGVILLPFSPDCHSVLMHRAKIDWLRTRVVYLKKFRFGNIDIILQQLSKHHSYFDGTV